MREEKKTNSNNDDVEQNRVIAVIAYVWILFLIALLKKDSDFAKYHGKQGLVFFIFSTILGFVIWIPVIGWFLAIFDMILLIIGMINAFNGKKQPLPIIGKFAESINV
jgi:uncharacterized membrane protein